MRDCSCLLLREKYDRYPDKQFIDVRNKMETIIPQK